MTLLARALYHNDAEAPNELSFRKGEILTVLNRAPQGLAGWWICNVRGKIGLAPGNRLQLLGVVQPTAEMRAESQPPTYDEPANHVYDVLPSPSPSEQQRRLTSRDLPEPPSLATSYYSEAASLGDSVYQVPEEDNVYQVPAPDVDEYSVPPDRRPSDDLYSLPPHHDFPLDVGDAAPHSNRSSGISSMTYQAPPAPQPPGSKENLATTPDSQFEDYDALTSAHKSRPALLTSTPRRLGSSTSVASDYYNVEEPRDRLRHSSASSLKSGDYADLPTLPDLRLTLSRDAALELLERVKASAEGNSGKLFKFISSKWKTAASLAVNGNAIRATAEALAKDVDEFIRFAYSVLAAANASADPALPRKVWKHLKPLEENHRAMRAALNALHAMQWRPEEMARAALVPETDHLNAVVTSVRSVAIDMRSLAVTAAGNAAILFSAKPAAAAVASPRLTAPSVDWSAAHDGVDYLEMSAKRLSLQSQTLTREERESLKWFGAQMESGVDILNQATDSLFKAVEKAQPPNVFVQHSKFVVMSAQKLVYIGDSIGRSLKHKALAHEVMSNASEICEMLKSVVSATKTAAEKHPNPAAVQQMMDAVIKVSSAASRLQLVVANAANAPF